MQLGAESGVGFDIAENILNQAETTAREAGVSNCVFVRGDILAIEPRYHGAFDFIFFTIGAITWFEDLVALFQKVADCLRPGGRMMLHDFHPFINMLPLPGEPAFDAEGAGRAAYSYFRKEPWVESMAAGYMAQPHETRETFISFSHTLSDIVNAACAAGMRITRLAEFDYDVGLTEAYNGKGWPLSMLLMAEKG
jgi:SAM-dependent methyltransferase